MSISKKNDSESREHWELARKTREKIQCWPEWKREIRLTEYSVGFGSHSSCSNPPVKEKPKTKNKQTDIMC